jgi:SARP family transcriptional regulator, regulator of embCAB operon
LLGWYEDWVLVEAEGWRQLRLHALEAAAGVLADVGRFGEAVGRREAAVDARPVGGEPARRVDRCAHAPGGNQPEALREFERYRSRRECWGASRPLGGGADALGTRR